jgi:RNA polymerase sigma-70 factor (ECF subfamily)
VDDLHQETFRVALEKIRRGELRESAGLSGFMSSLARNLATDHFRRGREPRTNDPAPLETVHSSELGALDRIVASEQARCVRQVLEELRVDRDREILRRFYLSSEAKEKICEDWGLSSLQFNRVLYRARERYRELYEKASSRRDMS